MCMTATDNHREIFTLIAQVSRTARCCQNDEAFCEKVTFSQFYVLDVLARRTKAGLAELHEILSVEKSTTTRLVNPLVQRGLVVRYRSSQDSRAVNLSLTQEGREIHGKVWLRLTNFLEGVKTRIPAEKRAHVMDATGLFLNALQATCASERCRG
jgi:DNA-binding MarR family transcriptional regulator